MELIRYKVGDVLNDMRGHEEGCLVNYDSGGLFVRVFLSIYETIAWVN